MALFNISDADLRQSAVKYRKDLLMMPTISAKETLAHMSLRPGVAGREVVGQLTGNIELGPYNPNRVDDTGVAVAPRVLETYLGSVIKQFDVNEAGKTVYGELYAQGQALTNAAIAKAVLVYLSAQLGKKINMAIWNGKRDASGDTTAKLFDGFDSITAAEIAAGAIAEGKGNFKEVEAITAANAVDVLKSIYRGASDELRGQAVKMFITHDMYDAYLDDYQATVGAVPYNTQFNKTFLEGSNGLCELVPLASKKGSQYIHLTPKANMLVGYGAGMADENIAIEKYHPFLLSYVATMYFGCQFESISPERLMVAKVGA